MLSRRKLSHFKLEWETKTLPQAYLYIFCKDIVWEIHKSQKWKHKILIERTSVIPILVVVLFPYYLPHVKISPIRNIFLIWACIGSNSNYLILSDACHFSTYLYNFIGHCIFTIYLRKISAFSTSLCTYILSSS